MKIRFNYKPTWFGFFAHRFSMQSGTCHNVQKGFNIYQHPNTFQILLKDNLTNVVQT